MPPVLIWVWDRGASALNLKASATLQHLCALSAGPIPAVVWLGKCVNTRRYQEVFLSQLRTGRSLLSKHLSRRLWASTPGHGDVTMLVYMEPVYLYCGFIGYI